MATARAPAAGLSRPHPGSNGVAREEPSGPTRESDPLPPGRGTESLRRDLRLLKQSLRAASRPSVSELPRVFQTDAEFEEHRRILRDLRERDRGEDETPDETPDPEAVEALVEWAERRREIAAEARRLRLSSNG